MRSADDVMRELLGEEEWVRREWERIHQEQMKRSLWRSARQTKDNAA